MANENNEDSKRLGWIITLAIGFILLVSGGTAGWLFALERSLSRIDRSQWGLETRFEAHTTNTADYRTRLAKLEQAWVVQNERCQTLMTQLGDLHDLIQHILNEKSNDNRQRP